MIYRFANIVTVAAAIVVLEVPVCAQQKQDTMTQLPNKETPPVGITIHQEVDISASPQMIYHALLDSKQFNAFSGSAAAIDSVVGGAFSLFDGHIVGRNIELVMNQRIVQAWRAADWPQGVYSIARFELKPQTSGTHLIFDHTGFPVELRDHLAAGWKAHYWDLLSKYFH